MQIILVSHGQMAEGMVGSASMIIGPQPNLTYLGLYPEDDIGEFKLKLKAKLDAFGSEEVLCLSDLYHGSAFNAVVSHMQNYPISHLTGMNLGILIEACLKSRAKDVSARQLCTELTKLGATTIMDVNAMLEDTMEEESDE